MCAINHSIYASTLQRGKQITVCVDLAKKPMDRGFPEAGSGLRRCF